MHDARIQILVDDNLAPIPVGKLVLSSVRTSWSGFMMEGHQIPDSGQLNGFRPEHHLVTLCINGHGTTRIRDGAKNVAVDHEPGTISILAKDCELGSVSWSGAREVLYIEISPPPLGPDSTYTDGDFEVQLPQRLGIKDRQIEALLRSMRSEIELGCPSGKLYGESLSMALAAYLFSRYCVDAQADADVRKPQLNAASLRRVKDYIDSHLASDVSVMDLARIAELSPHYFSDLFKNTVGVTPHRYLLEERIEKAKKLLIRRKLSIVEIALALGFASQSHFTDVFRKITGTTPRRFKQEH